MRMSSSGTYIHISISVFLTFALRLNAFSQTDTLSHNGNIISSGTESPAQIHSLFAGAGSGSNMIYFGSTISKNQPFYSFSATYSYRNSFFISASTSHIRNEDPYLAFYNVVLNYSHVFNSWFDISAEIGGYKAPLSLQKLLFSDFAYLSFTPGFDWKLVYTKLAFGGLISEDTRGYILVKNSRYFEIPEFIRNVQISSDPGIDILFGELVKIETITGVTKYGASPPFRHFKKNSTSTSESYSSVFGLMDIEFSLPITVSYHKFTIEAETSYILPSYTNPDYPTPEGFSFYLNAYFKIF